MILGATGPEGAGKSGLMAYCALGHHAAGGRVLSFPGYDVFLPWTDKKKQRIKISEELPIQSWLEMGEDLQDAMILIDEIQNFFRNKRTMAIFNQLWTAVLAQRRKRNLTVVYTLQNWAWLDPDQRWLTHVLAMCKDLRHSEWGKDQKLNPGELSSVDFYDMKGFFTGYEGEPMGSILLKMKELWPCFNSYDVINPWAGFTKVKVNVPQMDINFGDPGAPDPGQAQEEPVHRRRSPIHRKRKLQEANR